MPSVTVICHVKNKFNVFTYPIDLELFMTVTLQDIQDAHNRIKPHIMNTHQRFSENLSREIGVDLYVKYENRQVTSSFKERGALNSLLSLSPEQRERGIVAMSAGNHAQGISYHATRMGIDATIVMPETTPFVKIMETERHGATVQLKGLNVDEASTYARTLEKEKGMTFVHPFDDFHVMAGQGTIALEVMEACPEVDTFVVPIGGGGLISGIATAIRAIKPDAKIYGVQTARYPSMKHVVNHQDIQIEGGSTIAEGIAVSVPGANTRGIVADLVDDIFIVDEEAIEQAICKLVKYERVVTEGAGAVGLSAVCQNLNVFKGRKTMLVLSGGNIDERLLASVLMRDLVRQGRIVRIRLDLMDKPGVMVDFSTIIANAGCNVIEVLHQRLFPTGSAKDTNIDLTIEARDTYQIEKLMTVFADHGYNPKIID